MSKSQFSFFSGSSRRYQQWDSETTSVGERGPVPVHKRPSALPHPKLRLPATVLSTALPAHLSPVSGPIFARQRPVLSKLPARPAAAAAPGLARAEAEPGEQPAPPAPGLTAPALSGVPQRGSPTVGPRDRNGTLRFYPNPWNTSLLGRRSGNPTLFGNY